MLNFFLKKSIPITTMNQNYADYCIKATNESVRKISEKYTLGRNKPLFQTKFTYQHHHNDDNDDNDDNDNYHDIDKICFFYKFIFFISISKITFFLYKRLTN